MPLIASCRILVTGHLQTAACHIKMSRFFRTTSRHATPLGDPRGVPKCTKLNPSKFADFLLGCLEGFGARRRRLRSSITVRGIQFKMEDLNDLLLFPDVSGEDIASEILKDLGVEDFGFDDIDTTSDNSFNTDLTTTNDSVTNLWRFGDTNAPVLCDKNTPTATEIYNDSLYVGVSFSAATTKLSDDYRESDLMQIDNNLNENECVCDDKLAEAVAAKEIKPSRGQKRKGTYETMRAQNNKACKAYREREKVKKSKLQEELEVLSDKNKSLHEKLEEKKSEVQRLQNMLIFKVLKFN